MRSVEFVGGPDCGLVKETAVIPARYQNRNTGAAYSVVDFEDASRAWAFYEGKGAEVPHVGCHQ